jgi:hypothetical protein
MRRLEWGRIGAWGRASQARNREASGYRPALNGVCQCELAGRGQASGEKNAVLKGLFGGLPSPRKNGPRS